MVTITKGYMYTFWYNNRNYSLYADSLMKLVDRTADVYLNIEEYNPNFVPESHFIGRVNMIEEEDKMFLESDSDGDAIVTDEYHITPTAFWIMVNSYINDEL